MSLITGVKFKKNGQNIIDTNKIVDNDLTRKELAYLLWINNNKKEKLIKYYVYICYYYFGVGINRFEERVKANELQVWKNKLPEEVRMIQIKRREWCLYR